MHARRRQPPLRMPRRRAQSRRSAMRRHLWLGFLGVFAVLAPAHIAAKLVLKPGQKVLDIGCGWGGLALYLAHVADVEVLGVTLSERQLAVARRRALSSIAAR